MLRRLAAGVALVVALALAGCTPPEPTETTTPRATPTLASPSAEPEDQLLERAFQAATELLALVDQGFRDGALPQDELQQLASADLITMLEADLSEFRSQGLQVSGSSELDSPSLLSNETASETSGVLVLATCWDTAGTTTTGPDGEVVSGGTARQPRLFEIEYSDGEMLVTRTGPPSDPVELPGCE